MTGPRTAPISLTAKRRAAACLLTALAASSAAAGDWGHDFEAAEAESRRTGKPLLVHFHAEWCGPCRRMEATTLNQPEVRRFLGGPVIPVKINSDHRQDLVRRFGVKLLPSDLLVDARGATLLLTNGPKSPQQYLATLSGTAERSYAANRPRPKPRTMIAQKPKTQTPSPRPKTPAAVVAEDTTKGPVDLDTGDTVPVDLVAPPMLRGFSPVALQDRREWTKGSRQFEVVYRGQTYILTSAEEKRLFEANPRKYTPRLLGCDPVLFGTQDRAVVGDVEWAAFFRNELYLFATEENRRIFKTAPQRYTAARVVSVDQIESVVR